MPEFTNKRIDVFLGLNNMLNPSSAEYREGMAYRSQNARIDEHGLWTVQQLLEGIIDPPAIQACPHETTGHYKYLAVDSVAKIVTLGLDTICDVGPNKKLYSTDGSGKVKNATGDLANRTRPTITATTGDGTSTRGENGTYFYMCTLYNVTYDVEGLPSATIKSAEIDHSDGAKDRIVLASGTTATSTNKIRFYRSRRTSAADGEYNPTNKFYFLGEIATGTAYTDYLHDSEIADAEYEGRGQIPPDDIDCLASFNNRMLYLKGNVLYWSSAGRPEEVAQEYSITPDGSSAITCKPRLSIGIYGEAKFEIAELSGHKVLAALPYNGRLYIWTASLMGYLEPANRLEGYRFRLLRNGVGVTSDKVLALSPYGLFGADKQGIWLLTVDGAIHRLTDNVIDLYAGEDTTFSSQDFTNSFGVWCPVQQEYWWGVSGKIIAYQANRDIFVGPYSYVVSGGCTVVSDAYLTGAMTPSATSKDAVSAQVEFWLGQSEPNVVKDQLAVEVVATVASPGNITVKVWQNNVIVEDALKALSDTISNGTGVVAPAFSGRFFKVDLTLPNTAFLAVLGYKYNAVGWGEEFGRSL